MGRPFLSDPAWVNKAEEGRSEDIQRCICCLRCMEYFQDHIMNGEPVDAVNPRACRESEMMGRSAEERRAAADRHRRSGTCRTDGGKGTCGA